MPEVKTPRRHRRINATTREFGRRVREARVAAGLSRAQLEEWVYSTPESPSDPPCRSPWIFRIEQGIRQASLFEMRRIAERLAVTIEHLVTGKN